MNEVSDKSVCNFNKYSQSNANISCSLQLNDNENTDLSFKDNDIQINGKEVYINS